MSQADFNKIIRTDIGDVLVHWTRANPTNNHSAFDVLKQIITRQILVGSNGFIRGGYNCVCFTESPMSDLVRVFSLSRMYADRVRRNRYEPYGIGVKKSWLFKQGGRPVIYGASDEFEMLDDSLKWRYVNYNPEQTDFTWEREWRIKIDHLDLELDKCFVVVPSRTQALEVIRDFGENWIPIALSTMGLPVNYYQ